MVSWGREDPQVSSRPLSGVSSVHAWDGWCRGCLGSGSTCSPAVKAPSCFPPPWPWPGAYGHGKLSIRSAASLPGQRKLGMPNTPGNAWLPQLCHLPCPNKEPQCKCPSCSHWNGKSHCLDAILYIKNLLLRSSGRDENITAVCLAPGIITTPGQPSEAPGDPAPPWGTTPSPSPWPQGLGTVRDGECSSHSASPLPVKLPLTAQLEFPVVGIHLAALPVLQLDPQGVGHPARQQVHGLIPQPVFP